MEITIDRLPHREVAFTASNGENNVAICCSPEIEAGNTGFRPMELLLTSLASCMSIDVLLMLKKQRQVVNDYSVKVAGQRSNATPALFTDITIHFTLTGALDETKVTRAIHLSETKYCSVHQMLKGISIHCQFTIQEPV